MERITVSLESELATSFDILVEKHGYASRSEAIRDLIRGWFSRDSLLQDQARFCVAQIGYVFNHHDRSLAERLATIQHEHHHLTVSSMHVHLDHENCLEVTFLRGLTREVRLFAHRLIAETGVRHGSIQLIPVEMDHADKSHSHGEGGPGAHVHLRPTS